MNVKKMICTCLVCIAALTGCDKMRKEKEHYLTLSEICSLATSTSAANLFDGKVKGFRVTCTYPKYAILEDESAAVIMRDMSGTFKTGDLIAGKVSGNVLLFNGYAMIMSLDMTDAVVVDTTEPLPETEVTLDQLVSGFKNLIYRRVILKNVFFEKGVVAGDSESDRLGRVSQIGSSSEIGIYSFGDASIESEEQGNIIVFPSQKAELNVGVIYDKADWVACEPPAEQNAFTQTTAPGEYRIVDASTVNTVTVPGPTSQYGFIKSPALRMFQYVDLTAGVFFQFSINSKTIHVGRSYTLSISSMEDTEKVQVVCVNIAGNKAWLRTSTGRGFIIGIEPQAM